MTKTSTVKWTKARRICRRAKTLKEERKLAKRFQEKAAEIQCLQEMEKHLEEEAQRKGLRHESML